ncbi:metacaspase-4-like [Panicum miliaceum]|uniref:Metacaspase-4-like n=1 Tax=Panicum miliaceum TaxID=4540 RepID=A0A3L6T6L9_PANMI|nr:metacaspase-4-like [Panicum miliaceum]
MGQKRAVLVGINYPGTDGELKGCLNDVARMRRCLVDRFGFDEAGIRVLADADPSTPPPTGANIRLELERLVRDARPGDTLFFHYSGHGLQLPAETGEDDDTGYDECIVPCDLNLIKDQDFTELVAKVPDGCLFTMVSDSCHSGGLIDKTKEQIGNSTKQNKNSQHRDGDTKPPSASGVGARTSLLQIIRGVVESLGAHLPCHGHHKQSTQNGGKEPDAKAEAEPSTNASVATANRSLPLPTFIEMLRDKTGRHDVGVGSIRTTLFHHFGHDASPKVKRFVKVMVGRLRHDGKDVEQGHAALRAALEQDVQSVEEVYAGPPQAAAARAALPRNGVLISGCQTDETSADATTPDGVSYGALSNAIQAVLAGRKRGAAVTNRELVVRARELLSKQGYTQQPGLYCSDEHAKLPFIC